MRVDRVRDARRLAALRDSALLDVPAQPALERLNGLAASLLGVPVSLISLVDEDRQFFAGQFGLPEPWASIRETPLSHSLCQHVVDADAPLTVSDAREETLTGAHLAHRDLGVVAYAGVPLRLSDGQTLGTLCAIDHRPRRWSAGDLRLLEDLAGLAAEIVDLHRAGGADPLHDPLTGLPTRELFHELTERGLAEARRTRGAVAVLAIDLDGFRLVNEALGHAAGDRILVAAAERLTAQMRDADAVCRLAGDEFAVLCDPVAGEREALELARRLREAVASAPFVVDGHDHALTATTGVIVASGDGAAIGADEIVQSASAALRRAKASASRAPEHADPTLRSRSAARLRARGSIAGAHERGEMRLAYQPVVDLRAHTLVGCEALVRWDHPQLGAIPPDAFIPEAERSGAIIPLGEWILDRACADLAAWRAARPDAGVTVGVNVAPVQLRTARFPELVEEVLSRAGLPASALTLEITERTLLDDRALYLRNLDGLRALGVQIALDDFGTGYSALGYLTRFPIDLLKLDRRFVSHVDDDPRAAALIKGILAMADGLGMRTLAEGIETAEQRGALQALGCRLGQGYHLGRPVPAADVAALLGAPGG